MLHKFKKIIFNIFFNPKSTIPISQNLKDKVVIITGASRGIGRHIAEILYKENAKLVLVARTIEETQLNFLDPSRKNFVLINADVRLENDCNKIIKKAIKEFGEINVLINNAGIFTSKPIELFTLSEWNNSICSNVSSIFLMSKAVIPIMKKQKEGFIINIGSKISKNSNPRPNIVLYATTKYAVEGFSFALGKELKKYGIRVSCLMPGTVNTAMSTQARKYLSPYRIGQVISMLIKFEDVDFENIIIKSKHQDI